MRFLPLAENMGGYTVSYVENIQRINMICVVENVTLILYSLNFVAHVLVVFFNEFGKLPPQSRTKRVFLIHGAK